MTKEIIRQEFERITESLYEGDFAKYDSGDYVNETQQYQWEGFHDGWKAALKKINKPLNMLVGFAQAAIDIETDDAPFNEWAAQLVKYSDDVVMVWDGL